MAHDCDVSWQTPNVRGKTVAYVCFTRLCEGKIHGLKVHSILLLYGSWTVQVQDATLYRERPICPNYLHDPPRLALLGV